jgi:ribonucleotide reductase beta subunit family protein with ferritin-like domain
MTVFNSNHVDNLKATNVLWCSFGIQRYDSYKYPVFEKLTQQQLGYYWRPEEISLQKIVQITNHFAQNKSIFLLPI